MLNALPQKDRREEIFDAALRCFNENGYCNASIDAIADAAAISKGGVYYYFGSKKELFVELFAYRCARYFAELRDNVHSSGRQEKPLEHFLAVAKTILLKDNDFLRFFLEFMSVGARDPQIHDVITNYYHDAVAYFKTLLGEVPGLEAVSSGRADQIARGVYFMTLGIFFTVITARTDFDLADEYLVHITSMLQTGAARSTAGVS